MRKNWEPENKEPANKQKEKAKSGLSPFVVRLAAHVSNG